MNLGFATSKSSYVKMNSIPTVFLLAYTAIMSGGCQGRKNANANPETLKV